MRVMLITIVLGCDDSYFLSEFAKVVILCILAWQLIMVAAMAGVSSLVDCSRVLAKACLLVFALYKHFS